MEAEKFHTCFIDDAVPFCVITPRTILFAYWDKLKVDLDMLLEQEIIAPMTQVTEWCESIVVAPKNGTNRIRMCVDFVLLKQRCMTRTLPVTGTNRGNSRNCGGEAKYFTVEDVAKVYHQCPLDKESQLYTTFITPFGRFIYLRAPYGLSSIAEH